MALSGIEWHSRLMLYNLILCVLLIVRLINFLESWPNYQSEGIMNSYLNITYSLTVGVSSKVLGIFPEHS